MSNLHRIAEQAVTGAISRGLTVATAESLTAGMVTAVLADTPGASSMLQGGVVSYQNSVKADVLGVPKSCSTPSAPSREPLQKRWQPEPEGSAARTSGCPQPAWPVRNRTAGKPWEQSLSASPRRRARRRSVTFSRGTVPTSGDRRARPLWSGCLRRYLPRLTRRKVAGNKI